LHRFKILDVDGPGVVSLLDDAIRFQKSCRGELTYKNDRGAAEDLGANPIPYRHCVYYYSK
jgi:hypothetical protein